MKSNKSKKVRRAAPAAVAVEAPAGIPWWIYAVGAAAALFAAFQVYWPAIHGPFLLDDTHLQYALPGAERATLGRWLRGPRPLLMFSYWVNFQQGRAQDTLVYHMTNVFIHFFNSAFILLAIRKVTGWAGVDKQNSWILSLFASGLFLLHPLQTESVAYVAGRSETLSVFWVLAALDVFLYRATDAISFPRAGVVLAFFAAAVLTKEHTLVLPALLLVTDYFWNPGFSLAGIRRNWKLYVPIAAGAALGIRYVLGILRAAGGTAGFHMAGLEWYQYFFTECRVLWAYLRLFLMPIGQNLDPSVPISSNVMEHGAIFGLAGLLAVSILTWIYRRRFPLAAYGWFIFLALIAPTSSFAPIRDPMGERRVYLPFIGLLFIVVEFLRRWKPGRNALIGTLALVLVAEAGLTYQRNLLWANAVDLWRDTASKSRGVVRPQFNLAYAEYQAGSCTQAAEDFELASKYAPATFDLYLDWALAYDCAGNSQKALETLQKAVALRPNAHVYSQIGMEYGKMGKYPEALDALAMAEELNPRFAMTYFYLGNIHSIQGDQTRAIEDYRRVLALDPGNEPAQAALARLGAR